MPRRPPEKAVVAFFGGGRREEEGGGKTEAEPRRAAPGLQPTTDERRTTGRHPASPSADRRPFVRPPYRPADLTSGSACSSRRHHAVPAAIMPFPLPSCRSRLRRSAVPQFPRILQPTAPSPRHPPLPPARTPTLTPTRNKKSDLRRSLFGSG